MQVKKWLGTWPSDCDTCKYIRHIETHLQDQAYFVDGRTASGMWGLMCPACHRRYGTGLGTGKGQKYNSKTLEKMEG